MRSVHFGLDIRLLTRLSIVEAAIDGIGIAVVNKPPITKRCLGDKYVLPIESKI